MRDSQHNSSHTKLVSAASSSADPDLASAVRLLDEGEVDDPRAACEAVGRPDLETEVAEAWSAFERAERVMASGQHSYTLAAHHVLGDVAVIEPVGRGGGGEVYRGRQEPPGRDVAVKLLHPGSGTVGIERFRREHGVLANLDHPNVVKVHRVGDVELPGGVHPYFVMQFVRGERPWDYAERKQLDAAERATLLAKIANGVAALHALGLVHRDLKPSNVLVKDTGEPTVLDLGLVRELETADSTITREGAVLGTERYMAPEQIEGGVATRQSDVYTLGVLGFELFTNGLPYKPDLRDKPALQKAIREADTERLPKSGLPQQLRVVLAKAMSRNPADRYRDAGELAADLHRFAADEPVLARPLGFVRQANLWAKREPVAAVLAAAVVVAVLLGAAASFGFGIAARQQAALAEQQRTLADEQRVIAEQEADVAEKALGYMTELFRAAEPAVAQGEDPLAASLLAEAAATLEFEDLPPAVELPIRRSLGRALMALGRGDEAEPVLRGGIDLIGDPADRRSIELRLILANAETPVGDSQLTDAEIKELLSDTGKHLADDDPLRLSADYLRLRRAGLPPQQALQSMAALADRYAKVLGEEDPRTLSRQVEHATHLAIAGHLEDAVRRYQELETVSVEALDGGHPVTIMLRNDYAYALEDLGRFDEASSIYATVLADIERVYGKENFRYETTLGNSAEAVLRSGDRAGYKVIRSEVYQSRKNRLPTDHPQVLFAAHNYAAALWHNREIEASLAVFKDVLLRRERTLGLLHPDTIRSRANVGNVYLHVGRPDEGIPLLRQAVAEANDSPYYGPGSRFTQTFAGYLAEAEAKMVASEREAVGGGSVGKEEAGS